MPHDLRRLLDDTASAPTRPVDLGGILHRARRRIWVTRVGVAIVAMLSVVGAVLGVGEVADPDRPPAIVDQPSADTRPSTAPESPSVRPSDPAGVPAPVELPGTVVASVPQLVEIDPATGQVIREFDAPVGEGAVHLSVTPDGAAVYHEELWTGCATRLHRAELDGSGSELLGPGLLPAVSPDGTQLAYVSYESCIHDNHALVVRDLATGQEQIRPLTQPDGHLARIAGLSWSPDSQRLAVEIGYTPQDDTNIGAPIHYQAGIVSAADPAGPIGSRQGSFDTQQTEIRHTTFRGARGTWVAVAYCCFDPDVERGPAWVVEHEARQVRLLDRELERTNQTLVEADGPISDIAVDPSGEHILYVETQPKDPGAHPQRDVLKLLSGEESFTVTEGATHVDWRPTDRATDLSDNP